MRNLRGLSLWQPWASLVAIQAKHFETRSWATDYRGPIVIHAAKFKGELDWYYLSPFEEILRAAGIDHISKLPLGVGLCTADLTAIYRVEDVRDVLDERERAFGNYADKRFAWKLENVHPFDRPIPARGAQGLWEWTIPIPKAVIG